MECNCGYLSNHGLVQVEYDSSPRLTHDCIDLPIKPRVLIVSFWEGVARDVTRHFQEDSSWVVMWCRNHLHCPYKVFSSCCGSQVPIYSPSTYLAI